MARLRNESLVLGFGLGGLAFSAIANSAEMRFVSKFDVAKEAVEPPGTAALHPHEILGIRFAPDGERIAVVFGIHSRVGAAPVTHVSVFAQRSSEVLYVTNISAQSGGYVSWSPAGTHLLIQSKPDSFVVDLTKNSQCDAEGSGETGFVSTSTFITDGYGGSTRLRFYDLNCQTIQQVWTKRSVSIDVEPEKSLLAVVSDGEVEVLRGPDWKPRTITIRFAVEPLVSLGTAIVKTSSK